MPEGGEVRGGNALGPEMDEGAVAAVDMAAPAGRAALVDIGRLADVLSQARGPILDRLGRALPKLSGDGSVDVTEWLADFERQCRVERVAPAEVIDFLLEGNARRVFRRLTVAEASQWEVVKCALLAEYALPRQEAWRRFIRRRLQAGEAVDVYVDDLERLGLRLGIGVNSVAFRVQFYEGLPESEYNWAVSREDAYTAEFSAVLQAVRARRRDAAGRGRSYATVAATAGSHGASVRRGNGANVRCHRCGGPHRVRACTQGRARSVGRRGEEATRERMRCYRCGGRGHFARDCSSAQRRAAGPSRAAAVAADERRDFRSEGERDATSSDTGVE